MLLPLYLPCYDGLSASKHEGIARILKILKSPGKSAPHYLDKRKDFPGMELESGDL